MGQRVAPFPLRRRADPVRTRVRSFRYRQLLFHEARGAAALRIGKLKVVRTCRKG